MQGIPALDGNQRLEFALLWDAAYRHRVRLAFGTLVLGAGTLPDYFRANVRNEVARRGEWQSALHDFAEDFFGELREASCRAVVLKGFCAHSYYPEGAFRDIWDLDCAVRDFGDFRKFVAVLGRYGGRIERLTIRRKGNGLVGAAEIRISEVGNLHKSIKVECQIGGQPQSQFKMRPFEADFWRQAAPIAESSNIYGTSRAHSLEVLAGEIVENEGRIRLRDFLDYHWLRNRADGPYSACGIGGYAMSAMLHSCMTRFAKQNGLPIPATPPLNAARSAENAGKLSIKQRVQQIAFCSARALAQKTRSDRIISAATRFFPLSELWEGGCYIDTLPFQLETAPLAKTQLDLDRRVLTTEFGQFILAPFGVLTAADIQTIATNARTT